VRDWVSAGWSGRSSASTFEDDVVGEADVLLGVFGGAAHRDETADHGGGADHPVGLVQVEADGAGQAAAVQA
jgi:hypothetical protein